MSDFIPTVTITVKEYDQLRRDAAPVQNLEKLSTACLVDAFVEYAKMADCRPGAKAAEQRLGAYLRYMQRCIACRSLPALFGDWEEWMKPGDAP